MSTEYDSTKILSKKAFYLRPIFGRMVLLSPAFVCVCEFVCQSLASPQDNSGPVQARLTKFGPTIQKNLVKVPFVLGGNWPWPSRSNLTKKSVFTPLWACLYDNSLPIQARIANIGPEVENSLVKIPMALGGNWPWPSRSNFIFKVEFSGLAATGNT